MDDLVATELSNRSPVPIDPLDPAYIIYTADATGHPKSVVAPHLALAN
ncbi:MAG: hypothetical protein QNJ46_34355 [Leptolyngbyaceae cyanobacterium MO_188.B28]|nr:hypothetical protein [Leptolyngbyaceae cyanobacterium MO_188.B28]